MNWMKSALFFTAIFISSTGMAMISPLTKSANALDFTPPDRGAPPATAGGATRGSCSVSNKSLTPLMPKQKLALTVSERPSFFWYVPKLANKTAEFLLIAYDEQSGGEVLYETEFTLPDKAGIVSFTMPKDAPALEFGKQYQWFLSVSCDSENSEEKITVDGWVEREEKAPSLALAKQVENLEASKKAAIYAKAGMWTDGIKTLVEMRCANPNDVKIKNDWEGFLSSVGLADFVIKEPLVNSCKKS